MSSFFVRTNADSYGHAIGIILVDVRTPFIPGDIGNASTYQYPVIYRTVKNLTIENLINQGDLSFLPAVIKVAKELEDHGVRAISSDCGYMLHFQKEVANAVKIPTILSSLIMLPLLEKSIAKEKKIGLICANKERLTPDLINLTGIENRNKLIIRGMENSAAFRSPILDEINELDPIAIEKDLIKTAQDLVKQNPEVGPILLECSNMPPYAYAIQQATKRPVFDLTSLINLYQYASFRKPFQGFY